jgi:acyl-CoA synthetase (NDP forming)
MLGLKIHADVRDVPGPVDLAVFTVTANLMPEVMKACVSKGIKGGVLISADFAETGEKGRILQEETVRVARNGGLRFIGPNGMGIWSSAVRLNVALEPTPLSGPVAFISQSGTFGGYLARLAKTKGYGLSKFVSIGNQADLKVPDIIEYLIGDPDTKVIILYMEGIQDGRRFIEVTKRAVRTKPILIYKGGSSPDGARAAKSHTASIAGADEIFDSMCKQAGMIRVSEVEHLFVMAEALIGQPLTKGNRMAVIGSGGMSVVGADSLASLGMKVPPLDEQARLKIKEILPPHAPIPTNPVDFAGGARTAIEEAKVAEILASLDYIDGIITNVPVTAFASNAIGEYVKIGIKGAEILAGIPEKYNKPVVCMRFSEISDDITSSIIKSAGIPAYSTPEDAARAMYALVKYSQIKSSFN